MDLRVSPRSLHCDRALNMLSAPSPLMGRCPPQQTHLQFSSDMENSLADERSKNRSNHSADVKKILREHIMSRHPGHERAPPVAKAGFRVPVPEVVPPQSVSSDSRMGLRRTVSEPALKWKMKKMTGARPNPLRRKISAPPSVRHRSDAGSDSPRSSCSSTPQSEGSSCDSLLNDSAIQRIHESSRFLLSPKVPSKPNITVGLPTQAGDPSLSHLNPLFLPLNVTSALDQRLETVLVLDQNTGLLHQQFVTLSGVGSVLPPQHPLSALRGRDVPAGSHGPLKRTRSVPTSHTPPLHPPGPHPHSPLLLPHRPFPTQILWTRSGPDHFKSNAPLSKIPSEDVDMEESRSSSGPGSDPCGPDQSRRPSMDSAYGTESNASSRYSLLDAPHSTSQAGDPSLSHLNPLFLPLNVTSALDQRLETVLVLDQNTGLLHQQFVTLSGVGSVPPPQHPLSALRGRDVPAGSHRPLKRTRSVPTSHTPPLHPPGPHPHSPLLLPHRPFPTQILWTRSGPDHFKSNAPLSKIPSEDVDMEESRSSSGPGSDPCGPDQSRRPSMDSAYGTESNASSRDSLLDAPHSTSQTLLRSGLQVQTWSHLPLMQTRSSPASTSSTAPVHPKATPLRFTTGLAYDSQMQKHECNCGGEGRHPEHPERTESIWRRLNQSGLRRLCELVQSRKATLTELQSVHSENHVLMHGYDSLQRLKFDRRRFTEIPSRILLLLPCRGLGVDIDTIWNEQHTSTASRVAAGCVTDLALKVAQGELKNGFAVVRPPGHHATRSSPLGFCYFNSVAIAAKQVQQRLNLKKILILDWDVHHGNGTQEAFYSDPNVLYISLHRYDEGSFFPSSGNPNEVGAGAGEGFNVNVAWNGRLDPPLGDAEYLAAFRAVVMPIAHEFGPELVLVSAGFDAVEGHSDELGGYKVTAKCFGFLTRQLMSLAGGKVVLALEGGHQLKALCDSAEACVSALLGMEVEPLSPSVLEQKPCANAVRSLQTVVQVQGEYWQSLQDTSPSLSLSYSVAQRSRLRKDLDTEAVQAIAALSVRARHSDRRQDSGGESI